MPSAAVPIIAAAFTASEAKQAVLVARGTHSAPSFEIIVRCYCRGVMAFIACAAVYE